MTNEAEIRLPSLRGPLRRLGRSRAHLLAHEAHTRRGRGSRRRSCAGPVALRVVAVVPVN